MRRTVRPIVLAASLAFSLTACASTENNGKDEPASPAIDDTAESDEGAGEQPTDPAGIAESYGLDPVPAGESVVYEWSFSNKPEQTQETEVAVSDYECGLSAIPEGEQNPEWDGGDTYPQYIEAEAEPGKDFCTFTMSYENVGNFPGSPMEPGGVLIGPQQHAPSDADHDISWMIQDYSYEVNPGETWEYSHVVSVPEGETPDALLYPNETLNSSASIAFLLDTTEAPTPGATGSEALTEGQAPTKEEVFQLLDEEVWPQFTPDDVQNICQRLFVDGPDWLIQIFRDGDEIEAPEGIPEEVVSDELIEDYFTQKCAEGPID